MIKVQRGEEREKGGEEKKDGEGEGMGWEGSNEPLSKSWIRR